MKLKDALKKFNFLKRIVEIHDTVLCKIATSLANTLKGNENVITTYFASKNAPITVLHEWDEVFNANKHKVNAELLAIENANRRKVGPRSIQVPYAERRNAVLSTYRNQDEQHVARINLPEGPGNLEPLSIDEAKLKIKNSSNSGLPYLEKKGKVVDKTIANFDYLIKRKDQCMLFTRTTENKKTRNVWGFPFADTLLEMVYYFPLLAYQRTLFWRAALISPDAVAANITIIIDEAIALGKLLYSVDFAAFDASVKYQYIIKVFDYIKSCFHKVFRGLLDYICERFYTIGLITPTGLLRGKHGVPSGSTFTNEVDSILQFGIAMTCSFIKAKACMIQGDDGVYSMFKEDIPEFEAAFEYAGLKLEKSKSMIAKNCVVFCQNLYHPDYRDSNGRINGVYSTYRALNRLMFQERFVDFSKHGIKSRDYYGIRTLSILENCKYSPLFEELVRFVLTKESITLDISNDTLTRYCTYLKIVDQTSTSLNHQYGTQVMGIREFASYKMAVKIMAEEEFVERRTMMAQQSEQTISTTV